MEDRFIFGAQYYRAPSPEPESWESDLRNMKALGMTDVKFWVQWGWCQRKEEEFYFDDVDRLMDLAWENGLKVTLNVIFDVAPRWLFKAYPDCVQITADGRRIEPLAIAYRQSGGFPGPCYNHPVARKNKELFLRETVKRYANHPAMDMWDVWNEPEQCSYLRKPELSSITCYCPSCHGKFIMAMQRKYGTLEKLNKMWGRCYQDWDEVELPKWAQTYADFIDFNEFHLDTMTEEGNWRLAVVKELDKKHAAYLHVVPNTAKIMNSVTGVDDFALAKNCDVFASTNFANPIWSILTLSAGRGKTCYNVECHIGNGSTRMHQKQVSYENLLYDFIPQIGLRIRGFLFWQYRAEILGFEAPSWGMTKLDGTAGCVAKAAEIFAKKIKPLEKELLDSPVPTPEIAIFKGRRNEIFTFAVWESLDTYGDAIENYVNAVYDLNFVCRVIDEEGIRQGDFEGIKLLILPECYCMDSDMIDQIAEFVKGGGHILCEAHLGLYEADRGRHSYSMPGCGSKEKLGICEEWSTAPQYLANGLNLEPSSVADLPDDMKKAMEAYGYENGNYFSIDWEGKNPLIGSTRYAVLSGEGLKPLGTHDGNICIGEKQLGQGMITYCGTNLGEGMKLGKAGFYEFLNSVIEKAGAVHTLDFCQPGVHIDKINDTLLAIKNSTDTAVRIPVSDTWCGQFGLEAKEMTGEIVAEPHSAEIFKKICF